MLVGSFVAVAEYRTGILLLFHGLAAVVHLEGIVHVAVCTLHAPVHDAVAAHVGLGRVAHFTQVSDLEYFDEK